MPAPQAEELPDDRPGGTLEGFLRTAAILAAAFLVSVAIFLLLVWGRTVR